MDDARGGVTMSDVEQQPENSKRRRIGKPFPKGVSGNPGGRPKGSLNITSQIRKLLQSDEGEAFAKMFVKYAHRGKFPFAKEVIDRIDGKMPDKHEHDGELKVTVFNVKLPHEENDTD